MRYIQTLFVAVSAATLALAPLSAPYAVAAPFNPNSVLDDTTIRRNTAMSYEDIRAFLKSKGGLADIVDIDPVDGLMKNGAQLIADAAARYQVNPQYIMALIQKESSAVETDAPNTRQLEWATGYALCDGCYRTSSAAQRYRGFAKQVDAGAGFIDWFFKNAAAGTAMRNVGTTYQVNNTPVTPSNVATAALYTYTPHLHGNLLLFNIWNRWFGDGRVGSAYPDGTLARNAKTGETALVQGSKFRPILNASVLATRFAGVTPIILANDVYEGLIEQKGGSPVRFPDFSLVRVEDGTIYLLVGREKRHIVSMAAFTRVGFNPEEVEDASAADLADYEDGEPIDVNTGSVRGQLWQNRTTGGVYYVEDGTKHPIPDRAVLKANFGNETILIVSAAELNALPTGSPVLFDDGILVKSNDNPTVYVISGGKKRSIDSEDAFLSLGYEWTSIVVTTRKMLDLHPTGEPVTIASVLKSLAQ